VSAPRVCSVCGYARGVVAFAVLLDGRLVVELRLCPYCRPKMLDAIEHAANYVEGSSPDEPSR
jgi:hypothetical protein